MTLYYCCALHGPESLFINMFLHRCRCIDRAVQPLVANVGSRVVSIFQLEDHVGDVFVSLCAFCTHLRVFICCSIVAGALIEQCNLWWPIRIHGCMYFKFFGPNLRLVFAHICSVAVWRQNGMVGTDALSVHAANRLIDAVAS